jgi:site-specific DNA-cytosine methylase
MQIMHAYIESLAAGLRVFAYSHGEEFRWISLFSGTGIDKVVLRNLDKFYEVHFGAKLKSTVVASAEIDPRKRAFHLHEHQPGIMVSDAAEFLKPVFKNIATGESAVLPKANALIAGFSCTTRSSQNMHAKDNVHCVQNSDKSTATGDTYRIAAQIAFDNPEIEVVVLENLVNLNQKESSSSAGAESSMSDSEFILSDFKNNQFTMRIFPIQCGLYGSWPQRMRNFYCALRGCSPKNDAILMQAACFLDAMTIGPGIFQEVLADDDLLNLYYEDDEPDTSALVTLMDTGKKKKIQWKTDHLEIYELKGVAWPPRLSDYNHVIDFGAMTSRMKELAILLHEVFPPKDGDKDMVVSADFNMSAKLLLQYNEETGACINPWKGPHIGCLTGHSRWGLRYFHKGLFHIRCLRGIEAMRGIGWELSDYRSTMDDGMADPFRCKSVDDLLLLNMAGNAFSGFALAPLLSSLQMAMGLFKADAPAEPIDLDPSSESVESSSDDYSE